MYNILLIIKEICWIYFAQVRLAVAIQLFSERENIDCSGL